MLQWMIGEGRGRDGENKDAGGGREIRQANRFHMCTRRQGFTYGIRTEANSDPVYIPQHIFDKKKVTRRLGAYPTTAKERRTDTSCT